MKINVGKTKAKEIKMRRRQCQNWSIEDDNSGVVQDITYMGNEINNDMTQEKANPSTYSDFVWGPY